jgi:hypothetical protein
MKNLFVVCVLLAGCQALAPDELQLGYGWGSVDTDGAVSRAVYETDSDTEAFWVAPTWYLSPRGVYPTRRAVPRSTGTSVQEDLGGGWEEIGSYSAAQGSEGQAQEDQGNQEQDTQDPEGQEESTGGVLHWWQSDTLLNWIERILLVVLGAGGLYAAPKVRARVTRQKG